MRPADYNVRSKLYKMCDYKGYYLEVKMVLSTDSKLNYIECNFHMTQSLLILWLDVKLNSLAQTSRVILLKYPKLY